MNTVLIQQVRPFIDGELQAPTTLLLKDGIIVDMAATADDQADDIPVIDARDAWLLPGAIDLGAHIPEPGYSQKGTVKSELKAAAHGGITQVCSLPDSNPVADSAAVIKLLLDKAEKADGAQLLPLGAMTPNLNGDQIANMVTLVEAGAIALSNARQPIKDSYVLRRLMEYAATYDITLMLTANDASLASEGHMHEGAVATRLGLNGIPVVAETVALSQILLLAEHIGTRIHISQISCGQSLEILAQARGRGVKVTADVCLANLLYTDHAVIGYNSQYHVQPPLRSEVDRQALLQGVKNGELAISSHHSPHESTAKKAPFADAAVGMSTFDTFMPQLFSLVDSEQLSVTELVQACSLLPGKMLGFDNSLTLSNPANAVLFAPQSSWQVSSNSLLSGGHNNPLLGKGVCGRVLATWSQGQSVYLDQHLG